MAIVIVRIKRLSIRLLVAISMWIVFACGHLSNYRYTWYYRYKTNESELHLKMIEQLKWAELYWEKLLKARNYSHNSTSDICTVLISSPRGAHPLLHYTLSSLVKAMTPEDKLTMTILVYNTARPPSLHKYAQQLSQAQIAFLKVINSDGLETELYLKRTQFQKPYHKWVWTESVDYISALSLCQTTNSSYILILQDDLIFTKRFFTKLRSALSNEHNCSWIKLFKSDFWNGWETENIPVLILLSAHISAFIMLTWLVIDNRKCYRPRWCMIKTYERLWNISLCPIFILLTFWLIWFGFVLVILISTNRQNFQFLVRARAGVYPIESSVPGALAQLYPRWIKPRLEEFLRKRLKQALLLNTSTPIDLLLNEFLGGNNIRIFNSVTWYRI